MTDFEKIRVDLLKQRFENELEYLKEDIDDDNDTINGVVDDSDDDNWIVDRVKQIEEIVKNIEYKVEQNDSADKGKNISDMFNEVEKYMYKKEWSKLPVAHKIVKVEEYVKEKYSDKSKSIQRKLIKDLSKHINNNKLRTAKYVTYNPNAEKIVAIPALTYTLEDDS